MNFADLKWYEFALPPVEEQKRIVARVLSSCAETRERVLEAALFHAELLLASLHEVRNELSAFPKATLGSLLELQPGRQRSPKYDSGTRPRPYLRAANLKLDYIDLSDVMKMDFSVEEEAKYGIRVGDVLIVEGGDPDKVGAPSFVSSTVPTPMCIQNTVIRARVYADGDIDPRYLYWILRSSFIAGEFERIATGTKLYHLGLKKLSPFEIPVPPIQKQVDVVQRLDGIRDLGDYIDRSLLSVTELSSSIRERVLRGVSQ